MNDLAADLMAVLVKHEWQFRASVDDSRHRVDLIPPEHSVGVSMASASGRSKLQALARALSLALSNIQNRGQ